MSRARDLANLADEATVLATDSEVSAAVAAIDLTNVQRIVPVDSNISVPGAPTSVSGTVANASSVVSFVAPTDNGGSTILSYTVISSPGNIKKSGTSSPITITGLTNGTAYTFTVKAHNIAGSSVASSASASVTPSSGVEVGYLVVAGGGGGASGSSGGGNGAGGGAGGLRSTVTATGGGGSLESVLNILFSTNYTVTVGAGGSGGPIDSFDNSRGANGNNSVFSTITSTGGGGGGSFQRDGYSGGSGGGAGQSPGATGGAGTSNQGYAGGNTTGGSGIGGSGGGGAGAVGGNCTNANGGAGGAGVATSITGSSVSYAGGGGGSTHSDGTGLASGGTGGGGNGRNKTGSPAATAGTANTGGGGGGSGEGGTGAAGGSGVVILRWLTSQGSITVGAGLTADATGTDGSYSYKKFTAGTGNVSFA